MTKEQIKELNQIRKKLIEITSYWEQESINEKMNDVNKLFNLYSLFYPIDFTKLESKYLNDEKYVKLILKSTDDFRVIKLLNKDVIFKDKDIWFFDGDKIINAYGADIVKYVDKSLWLNRDYYVSKLIKLDINIFKDYYDDIIKNNDLIKAAIDANYDVIKYIKNNDFNDDIKAIIVNKLQALESEIYD